MLLYKTACNYVSNNIPTNFNIWIIKSLGCKQIGLVWNSLFLRKLCHLGHWFPITTILKNSEFIVSLQKQSLNRKQWVIPQLVDFPFTIYLTISEIVSLFKPVHKVWVNAREAHVIAAWSSITRGARWTWHTHFVGSFSNPVPFWGIIADQVGGLPPDGPPHHHVITHINRTADSVWCRPDHLCIMGTHGSVTAHRASGVTVSGIWKDIIFHFIIPGLDQLEDRAIVASSDGEILAQISEKVRRSVIPDTGGCPGFCWPGQCLVPHHVLHIGCRWENVGAHFVVVVQDGDHVALGDVALFPGLGQTGQRGVELLLRPGAHCTRVSSSGQAGVVTHGPCARVAWDAQEHQVNEEKAPAPHPPHLMHSDPGEEYSSSREREGRGGAGAAENIRSGSSECGW